MAILFLILGGFMQRPEYLPENLDNQTIKWLRIYGYCLNSKKEYETKIRDILKKWYTYEYYFYVDYEIKEEAEKIFEGEEHTREFYKSYYKRYRNEKRRLIKELYALEKKGIR